MIKKHRALIQSSNNITLRQKKAFNGLVYYATEQLAKEPARVRFTCSVSDLKTIIADKKRVTNLDLKKSLKDLIKIVIEFNILEDDKFRSWHAMSLISEVEINDEGEVLYVFPPTVRDNIIKPEIFCPIDLEIVSTLDSKFALAIYEFCKDYIKVEVPKLAIEDFRKMFSVEDKYERLYDLKKNVLEPAKLEINEKTDITIDYEFITKGKRLSHIKFHAKKKEVSEDIEVKEKKTKKPVTTINDIEFLTDIISLIPEGEVLTSKEKSELKELTVKHGKEIVTSNIKYTSRQNYQNYFVYLRKAIAEDYAEKDRKINEMKAGERKVYELKVKEEEAEAEQRELKRKQAVNIYQALEDEEREAIEAEAEKLLEKVEGIETVKKLKVVYANMKKSKIIELVITKYLNK